MTWFAAGAAAVAVAGTLYSSHQSAKAATKQASEADAAQGAAVVKERLNKTISNSYATAFDQMRLSLQKRQEAQQGADISAAALAAHGSATLGNAATSTIGQTTQQITSDIDQKVTAAQDRVQANWQNAQENYNNELDMMRINTAQTTPTLTKYDYMGPNDGQQFMGALFSGAATFASSYAGARMKLGPGSTPSSVGSTQVSLNNQYLDSIQLQTH